jgi:hypothetical protein
LIVPSSKIAFHHVCSVLGKMLPQRSNESAMNLDCPGQIGENVLWSYCAIVAFLLILRNWYLTAFCVSLLFIGAKRAGE